jgi:hypothetical protein
VPGAAVPDAAVPDAAVPGDESPVAGVEPVPLGATVSLLMTDGAVAVSLPHAAASSANGTSVAISRRRIRWNLAPVRLALRGRSARSAVRFEAR